ncbi:MAG: hypothetical protein LBS05_10005 [Tannerellaceae bacterium]|jgi:hypothetical protein|nr:hypothetical protein [Tannerellaceae bacterium]
MRYRTLALWLAAWLAPLAAEAQFLDYGTDPSRLRWNEASIEHYTIIYPRGLDSLAYRYALYLENVRPHLTKTIGSPVKGRFPVVLHPTTMTSNGMVAWSPRRMELLSTPPFNLQSERWDKHLVVHESRHVVQTGRLMTGVFRPLYYLMGEQAAGIASLFVPRWFFEGDAVGMETALTAAGRGRLPEFQMTYRARILSATPFSFDKWYFGSYRDYTGDYYALGYDMVAFARYRYGADIWKKTAERYVAHPFAFPPFGRAFKHQSGISVNRLFEETFAFLRNEWTSADTAHLTPRYLTPETRQYTSYRYPQAWNDTTVIALQSSLSDLPTLVAVDAAGVRRLAYLGNLSGRITLQGNRVYWLEQIPSIRWTHESLSAIKYYDLRSSRIHTLASRRRYVALAAADSLLAASLTTEDGQNRIVRIDARDGSEYPGAYPTPDNAFVKELTAGGTDTLYAVAVGEEGASLLRLDLRTGRWDECLPPTPANITSPIYAGGTLYFESGLNGINNLYRLDPSNGETRRLTSARFGAFQPALSTDSAALLMADYQANGYRLAALPLDSLGNDPADFSRPTPFTLAETLARQEGFRLNDSSLRKVDFQPRPYRKASHLLHVHSWAPLYYNVSEIRNGNATDFTSALKPGFTLLSQNALNTAIMQASWYYENGYHHGLVSFLYQGWFPVIHLNIDYGDKAFDARWTTNDQGATHLQAQYTARTRFDARLGVYLPFNLTTRHYVRGIQPSITYHFVNNRYQQYGTAPQAMSNYQYLLAEVRFYNYRKMAQRDILPRSGYQLRLQHLSLPSHSTNYGNLYAARLTAYLPGIAPQHSLMLRTAYQYQPGQGKPLYIPQQLLEAPRGHVYTYRSLQQMTLKVDYAFPIAYPDLSAGTLAYLRRLRANLFYDLTANQTARQSPWTTQSAYGADLIADWNALQLSFPLTTGLRLIQPLAGDGNTQVEVLFSINF